MKKIQILTILFLVIGQFIAACASTTSSPTKPPEIETFTSSPTKPPEIETLDAAVIQTATSLAKTVEASKPPQPSITPLPPTSPPPSQTPLPTLTPCSSCFIVTFKITGTARGAMLGYECMGQTDHVFHYVAVPWEKSRSCLDDPKGKITLTATFFSQGMDGGSQVQFPPSYYAGTLTCEIYVDGELVDSDSETVEKVTGWHSADCSYQPLGNR